MGGGLYPGLYAPEDVPLAEPSIGENGAGLLVLAGALSRKEKKSAGRGATYRPWRGRVKAVMNSLFGLVGVI